MASKKSKTPTISNSQFWRSKELGFQPHEVLDSLVQKMQRDQAGRYRNYARYARAMGQDMSAYGDMTSELSIDGSDLTINEMAATLETMHAQVFRNRVVPGIIASDASYDEFERAKGLSRFVEGVFSQAKVHALCVPKAGMDCLVFGTGAFKVSSRQSGSDSEYEVVVERVSPRFLFVDRVEGRHASPRSVYQRSDVDRFVLFEMFGEEDETLYGKAEARRTAIESASVGDDEFFQLDTETDTDMVTVWEVWHLPSGPKAKDGRHVIWIKGCTLLDEPYESERFPFTFMTFGVPLAGVWGNSAVKEILPAQQAHDKMSRRIDLCSDLAVPRILSRRGNGINISHVDDVEGAIIEADDIGPAAIRDWIPAPIHPDQYRERDGLVSRMRSRFGVSGFEASNELPSQMREASGAAMERWQDAGSARQAMLHRSYENAMEDLADLVIDECMRIRKRGGSIRALARGAGYRTMETLDFDDVFLDRKKFVIQVQPVSHMSRTFSGRLEELGRLRAEGLISPKSYLRLLEVPDLDGEADMITSSEDIIRKNLAYMAKHKKYLPPLQFDDLKTIVKLTTDYINDYRVRDNADEEVVAILARYIDDAIALQGGLGKAEPLPGPPMGPPVGPPPGEMGMPMQGPPEMGPPPVPEGAPPAGPPMMPPGM